MLKISNDIANDMEMYMHKTKCHKISFQTIFFIHNNIEIYIVQDQVSQTLVLGHFHYNSIVL